MTSSIVSSLFSTLDLQEIREIADRLGEPSQAISMGLESSTASLIGGLANRSDDPKLLNQIFNLVSQAPAKANLSDLASAVTDPGHGSPVTSSLIDSGRGFLSLAFGQNQSSVVDLVGKSTGLRSSAVARLMSVAAPLLMTALGRAVREGRLNPAGLKNLLVEEGNQVSSLLPPGFKDTLKGGPPPAPETRPIALGKVSEGVSRNWLWLFPVLALLFTLFYWGSTRPRPTMPLSISDGVAKLGRIVTRNLPNNVPLNVPEYGVESQLIGFIEDPAKGVDQNVWFSYDRLVFDTDSASLGPASGEQLRNIAAILNAYPNVRLKIGGYTDNVGDSQNNLQLSQDRANGVKAELVTLGIAPERLEAQGYGEQNPIADNATAEGRAQNRRVAMNVTQK